MLRRKRPAAAGLWIYWAERGDSMGGGRWSKMLRKSFTHSPDFGRDFKNALRSA